MTTLVVLARAPRPGECKTRLIPGFGPVGAARLAAAALQDTLDVVARAPAALRVLALDGDLADAVTPIAVPAGFEVVAQVSGTHGERIAAALAGCRGRALLVGMDTPQLTPELLTLDPRQVDAWLGIAEDGGWWALGLTEPGRTAEAALTGVPLSTPSTGVRQRQRLHALGLRVADLPVLRDVDTAEDARAVAAAAPHTRFARLHEELTGEDHALVHRAPPADPVTGG